MDVTGTWSFCSVRSLMPITLGQLGARDELIAVGQRNVATLVFSILFADGVAALGGSGFDGIGSRTFSDGCFHRKYEGSNVAPESPPWASDNLPRAVPRKGALSAFQLDRLGHRLACVLDQHADALDRRPLRIVEQMRIARGGRSGC